MKQKILTNFQNTNIIMNTKGNMIIKIVVAAQKRKENSKMKAKGIPVMRLPLTLQRA